MAFVVKFLYLCLVVLALVSVVQVEAAKKKRKKLHEQNYYERLGVANEASKSEIRKSYFELAKTLHPDKVEQGTPNAAETWDLITSGYEVLIDKEKRERYDKLVAMGQIEFTEESGGSKAPEKDMAHDYDGKEEELAAKRRAREEAKAAEEAEQRRLAENREFYKTVLIGIISMVIAIGTVYTLHTLNESAKIKKKKEYEKEMRLARIEARREKDNLAKQKQQEEEARRKKEKAQRVKNYKAADWTEHDDADFEELVAASDAFQQSARSKKKKSEEEENEGQAEQQEEEKVAEGDEATEEVQEEEEDEDEQIASFSSLTGDNLYCVACDKQFKSEGTLAEHEKSKKHKQMMKKLGLGKKKN